MQNDELFMEMQSIKQKQFILNNENNHLKKELEQRDKVLASFSKSAKDYSKHQGKENNSPKQMKSPHKTNFIKTVERNRQHNDDLELNYLPCRHGEEIFNQKLGSFCQNVLSFIYKIALLQESITKKLSNVKEMKMDFEVRKRQLLAQAERYIQDNTLNQFSVESYSISLTSEKSI